MSRRTLVALILILSGAMAAAGEERTIEQEMGFLDFRSAASACEKVLKTAPPGSEMWIKATLGLAVSLHYRQPDVKADKERAAELYERVIEATDGKSVQALALVMRGRLSDQVDYFGDRPDAEAARKCYDRVLKDWAESPLADLAMLYRAQLDVFSMDKARAEQGVRDLTSWLNTHPANELRSLQLCLMGLAYTNPLDQPLKAVEAYIAAEKAGLPPLTKLDAYYWRIANLAQRGGDRQTAVAYYRRIMTEVKRSGFAYEAQLRIRELGETPPPLEDPFAADDSAVKEEGR